MRFLLDDITNRGSEAGGSLPVTGGDSFGTADHDAASPLPADPAQREKARLIEEAKNIMRRGIDRAPGRLAARIGAPKNVVSALQDDTSQARQEVKDFAKQKARDLAKDKIGKRLAETGIKRGLEKGLEKGAGAAIKQGGKQAAKSAGKAIGKGAIKGGAKVAAKGVAKIGTGAAVEGGVAAVGVAAGAVSFGLGFVLSILLDIAISLGINDAVDAVFELKEGNVKQATFLAIRGATKVGIFIWFLIAIVFMLSIAGVFISIPILIGLNIYMILGAIPAFKGIPQLQGMVWWERVILIAIDIIAFLILAAFIGGIVYYLCSTSGLGSGGATGTLMGAVASGYDWWTGSTAGSFANDICTQVNAPAFGGGGDFGGAGAGGNF